MILISSESLFNIFQANEASSINLIDEDYAIIASEILRTNPKLIQVLQAIELAGHKTNIITTKKIFSSQVGHLINGSSIRNILEELKEFNNFHTDLSLINMDFLKIKNVECYSLSEVGVNILRNHVYETKEQFEAKKTRQSGGLEHVYMVELVEKKLKKSGWKILAIEESFRLNGQVVYFDILCFKEENGIKKFRAFECETTFNTTREQLKRQVHKNIIKAFKLGEFAGNRCNIICLDQKAMDLILDVVRPFDFQKNPGLIQVTTLHNFLHKNFNHWVKFGTKNRLMTGSPMVAQEIEKKIQKFNKLEKKDEKERKITKKVDALVKEATKFRMSDCNQSLDLLFIALRFMEENHVEYLLKKHQVKYLIKEILNDNQIYFINLFYFVENNLNFLPIKRIQEITDLQKKQKKYSYFLKSQKQNAEIYSALLVNEHDIKRKIIGKNNIHQLNLHGFQDTSIPVNIFIETSKHVSKKTLKIIFDYIENVKKNEFITANQLQLEQIRIFQELKNKLNYHDHLMYVK
ncbi:MAG: hypothetical protein EAX96_06345 [Candidatus Lokiarchaeota archaeon]|nr:hypothetical protein [Candidatus Lokiarchaeota archaeon]